MRKLDPDEAELWARVAATIRPLSREPKQVLQATETVQSIKFPTPPKARGRTPLPRAVPAARPTPLRIGPQMTLDGGWDRRLRAGSVTPGRTLDLHGHSLDDAWWAIDQALEAALAAGDRLVLLVTGHERPGEPPVARGKIRAAVNDWLAASRHAPRIAAVRPAHRRHGGGGSLYLVLRR